MMNLLIYSHSGELQVDVLMPYLKKAGLQPILFERYRSDHLITFEFKQDCWQGHILIAGKSYPLNEEVFPCVWSRVKPVISSEMPDSSAPLQEIFCRNEWRQAATSLNLLLKKSKWINPLICSQEASNKPYQLHMAQQVGLLIPHTIVTNNYKDLCTPVGENDFIYKTLSSFFSLEDTIFTNQISLSQIQERQDAIAMAPGIFQCLVKKEYELRVTIIGEKVFTIKIFSQKRGSTSVDWRRDPYHKIYRKSEISNDTKEKLLTFHRNMGLVYASYDFIVDTEGRDIFLECNPAGQWVWTDKKLENMLCQAMLEEFRCAKR